MCFSENFGLIVYLLEVIWLLDYYLDDDFVTFDCNFVYLSFAYKEVFVHRGMLLSVRAESNQRRA